jgi:hypothetical protein
MRFIRALHGMARGFYTVVTHIHTPSHTHPRPVLGVGDLSFCMAWHGWGTWALGRIGGIGGGIAVVFGGRGDGVSPDGRMNGSSWLDLWLGLGRCVAMSCAVWIEWMGYFNIPFSFSSLSHLVFSPGYQRRRG